jgi:hypothetical protein
VLLEAAVLAEHVTVVAPVDHDRVVGQARGFEGVEDAADLVVQEGQRRVVGGLDPLALLGGQVAEEDRLVAAVGLREWGRGELLRAVAAGVLAGVRERRVRLVEADDQGERLVLVPADEVGRLGGEEVRFHRRLGQAHVPVGGVEPDGGRVDERSPGKSAIAALGWVPLQEPAPLGACRSVPRTRAPRRH